ncbi:hypothetical protein I0C86_31010 [Plantactinospora sp. S1510]|uniref:DUF4262 domain-containing protein n=1 Tax=Plantactinospora alkalitolerans TaxID=2789879 RepID=A0ABS0H4H1_9ACTN|nr:hypothetical protein [Plantactinospora alkalitolerans]MBF9133357.1 hypothetical protein [Plantactinospora alkalitolerans]
MGNRFTAYAESAGPGDLYLSNGGTDVFFDVLTLAGCHVAETPWQQNLVLLFADGHRYSQGFAGFDLGEIPWTVDWPAEKEFLLRVIDTALGRHGWHRLRYDPPAIAGQLARYREMVVAFTPAPVDAPRWGDWRTAPAPALLTRCPEHDLYEGEAGCRLCDPSIQPIEPIEH